MKPGPKPMQPNKRVQRLHTTLPPELLAKYHELGGQSWLRRMIQVSEIPSPPGPLGNLREDTARN